VRADEQTGPTLEAVRRMRTKRESLARRAFPVALLTIVVVVTRGSPGPGWHGASLGVSLALAGVGVVIVGMALREGTGRVHRALLVLLVLSSAALMWLQPAGPGAAALLMAILLATRLMAGRIGVAITVLAGVSFLVFMVLDERSLHVGRRGGGLTVAGVVILASMLLMALFARRVQQQEAQADQMLAELEHTRGAEVRAAALAERQRLAREMHDVLAHSLSGLMVQLEGARLLAAGDPADPRLGATIERAHHLARGGLEEARRAIGMLRGDDLPGPEAIEAMASEFERDSGIPCRFAVSGQPHPLSSETMLAIYRVAQEALTNVRKHARAGRVELRLVYESDGVRLTVEDMGAVAVPAVGVPAMAGAPASPPRSGELGGGSGERAAGSGEPVAGSGELAVGEGTGYGLTGMRERAELLGGTLTAGPTGTGFRVELRVPG
jgi:signal transduction histidine kinase